MTALARPDYPGLGYTGYPVGNGRSGGNKNGRPVAGRRGGNQYGSHTVRYPSDKQVGFVEKLLRERVVPQDAELDAQVADMRDGVLNLRATSDLIEMLLELPQRTDIRDPRLASEKQVALVTRLLTEKEGGDAVLAAVGASADLEQLTKRQASDAIDRLFALSKKQAATGAALESGIYRVGDKVFKVYTNQAKTHMLAKLLVLVETGEVDDAGKPVLKGTWEYQGAASRFVKADQRMSLEQAKEFGTIYGVCCKCGATLTDETSIANGIGPVCGSSGW